MKRPISIARVFVNLLHEKKLPANISVHFFCVRVCRIVFCFFCFFGSVSEKSLCLFFPGLPMGEQSSLESLSSSISNLNSQLSRRDINSILTMTCCQVGCRKSDLTHLCWGAAPSSLLPPKPPFSHSSYTNQSWIKMMIFKEKKQTTTTIRPPYHTCSHAQIHRCFFKKNK